MEINIDLVDFVMTQYNKSEENAKITECKKHLKILHKMIARNLKTNRDLLERYLNLLMEFMSIQNAEIIELTYKLIKKFNF